jgi:hypothetical protein
MLGKSRRRELRGAVAHSQPRQRRALRAPSGFFGSTAIRSCRRDGQDVSPSALTVRVSLSDAVEQPSTGHCGWTVIYDPRHA